MKTECSIVRDLLPLYVENMVSAETAQYVSEHLKACDECQAELAKLKDGADFAQVDTSSAASSDDIGPLKKVMKRMDLRSYYLALLILLYFWIFDASLFVFWCFVGPTDGLGFAWIFQIVVLPVATLAASLLIGKRNYWGNWKWLSIPVFGLTNMMLDFFTFQLKNMIASGRTNMPMYEWFLVGAAVSAVGLLIGVWIHRRAQKTVS